MQKLTTNFFPQGLATGDNFCNRLQERQRLIDNITSARPTLIMSPRRYGKTSLVLFVLNQLKLPFAQIDLYSELDENDVQNTILSAIGDILYSVESMPQKAFKFVAEFFSELSVGFTIENSQIRVQFSKSVNPPAKNILAALKKLDTILQAKNHKAIFFIDEFQRLAQISASATIEGALRHVAQSSKNITFIFSGSNRHLLSSMFDDKNKPLYKLCDRMIISRIASEHYLPFIQEKSKIRWNKVMPKETVELILEITQLHQYYINVLCHKLWLLADLPSNSEIENTWHQYAAEEKTNVLNEIDLLSHNQAKMLIALAKCNADILPTGKEFFALNKFSSSSASQALDVLERKDYIYHNVDNKCRIVDPLIKYVFSHKNLNNNIY